MKIPLDVEADRDLSDPHVFADITPVPFLGYFNETADTYLEFDGDLTAEERRRAVFRATTTLDEDAIFRDWASALSTLQAYLDITHPTAVQTTAQVKFQARVLRSLLQWDLRDYSGTT